MAHALLGATMAAAKGDNAVAGAAGAGSAPLIAATLAQNLYGSDAANLTESQKDTVAALTTLAGSLAGGIAGGNAASALAGGQGAKNEVENNYLSANQALDFDREMQQCRAAGKDCAAIVDKYRKISDQQRAALDKRLTESPLVAEEIDKALIQGGIQATERPAWMNDFFGADVMRDDQVKAYVQYWNTQDLAKIDQSNPAWAKFAAFVSDPESQIALLGAGLATKDLLETATRYLSRNTATVTVDAAKIGLQWGKGNIKQGMPWEDFVGTTLPADARLPKNFKTFDYYDGATKTAISAKSLDTQTLAKLNSPNQLYSSLKSDIDAVVRFSSARLSGRVLNESMIANREISLAVPAKTTTIQWVEINRAVEYAKMQGVKIEITQVK